MITNQEQNVEELLLHSLYAGVDISTLTIPNELIKIYNQYKDELNLPDINKEFDYSWFMPDKYKNIDLYEYIKGKCNSVDELNRAEEELMLFDMAGKLDFVKYLVYLVDHMKQNGVVWGVGRGSSISVFVFYLIGIHKVNSLKYKLDYSDFFKIGEEK